MTIFEIFTSIKQACATTTVGTAFYFGAAKDGTAFPYATFAVISAPTNNTFDGQMHDNFRFQVSVFAEGVVSCDSILNEIDAVIISETDSQRESRNLLRVQDINKRYIYHGIVEYLWHVSS